MTAVEQTKLTAIDLLSHEIMLRELGMKRQEMDDSMVRFFNNFKEQDDGK